MSSPTERARNAGYAKRHRANKREGTARRQRTASDKAALLSRPYGELSDKEKECVRYYRKQTKKQQQQVQTAAPVVLLVPPPTRSPSPAAQRSVSPRPFLSLPPAAAITAPIVVKQDSLLLSTLDLEEIMGRPLSPPPAAVDVHAETTSTSDPVFDVPIHPSHVLSPSPIAVSSSPVATSSDSPCTSAAAAAAMSSCSKLRQSIIKKRKNLSVLNPNVKRREISKGIKIDEQHLASLHLVPQRAAASAAEEKLRDIRASEQENEEDDDTTTPAQGGRIERQEADKEFKMSEEQRRVWREYHAANRDRQNEKNRQRYKAATAAIDALKRDRLGGQCSVPGCDVPWSRCDVDHLRPELKGRGIASCTTVGMLQREIGRNTTVVDGVQQLHLRLLCPTHHRMHTAVQRGHRHAAAAERTFE
jgi:hypothetical protein